MKIPLTERFSLKPMVLVIAAIFIAQIVEGTHFAFAILTACFLGLWAVAYNVAGGMAYPSGAFVLFNGFFTVVLGIASKVLMGEAGDRHFRSPNETMLCYCVAMGVMIASVFLVRNLRGEVPIIKDFDSLEKMKQAAIVSFVVGEVLIVAFTTSSTGSIGSAVRLINSLPLIAIVLATTYEIRRSGGKSAVNWMVVVSVATNFLYGVVFFAKEGMLIGPTAWVITGAIQGYNFKKRQLLALAAGGAFLVYYLVPYSQYVRNFHGVGIAENAAIAVQYLGNLSETRELYLNSIEDEDLDESIHIFDERIPFLDRAVMLAPDDALVDYTNQGHVFGLSPTINSYENLVPHFIWKDKNINGQGNLYGHELGMVNEGDDTTGISFSAMADVYHQATWLGLLLLLPITTFVTFLIMDSLVGSARYAPFAMLWIVDMSHQAAEAGLTGLTNMSTYGLCGVLFAVFVSKRVAPFVFRTLRHQESQQAGEQDGNINSRQPVRVS